MLEVIGKYWIQALCGIFMTVVTTIIKTEHKRQEAIKQGVVALLNDRLFQSCTCFLQRGVIQVVEMRNIEKMYNAYIALGGNGTITELFERVKKLQIQYQNGGT